MKNVTILCDRCRTDITHTGGNHTLVMDHITSQDCRRFDLCGTCGTTFLEWISHYPLLNPRKKNG